MPVRNRFSLLYRLGSITGLLLAVLCLISCGSGLPISSAAPEVAAVASSQAASPAAAGVYLGVWQPFHDASQLSAAIGKFEQDAGGKQVAIIQFYNSWPYKLDRSILTAINQLKATPLVTLNPGNQSLDEIAAGKDDAFYTRWASDLAAFGAPVLFRWAVEMNGNWFPWCVAPDPACNAKPEDYVDAWQHLHHLFVAAGATNVRWVWCPNVTYGNDAIAPFDSMYPGDAYVDWVGLDGYNGFGGSWASFKQIFGHSYQRIIQISNKPVIIAEMASGEAGDNGAQKAAWIADAFLNGIPSMKWVKAVVWFNEDQGGNGSQDWRIESSTAASRAFAAAVASPRYVSTKVP